MRIVVSHLAAAAAGSVQPRLFPNWLDTAGHSNGAMLLRYVAARDYPPVRTAVVPVADLLRGEIGESA